MELLAQYVTPLIGRPVAAILPDGKVVCGIVDRIHDGHLVMRPVFEYSPEIAAVQLKLKNRSIENANIRAWGGLDGYPYGWGYENYGWGLGWWWVWPLFALAAITVLAFLE